MGFPKVWNRIENAVAGVAETGQDVGGTVESVVDFADIDVYIRMGASRFACVCTPNDLNVLKIRR